MISGFRVNCALCNSENVELEDEIDYNYDEEPFVWRTYLTCQDCGNRGDD